MPTTAQALNSSKLAQQQALFEAVLVKETLAEIRFIEEGMGRRAQHRPGFTEKLITYTTKATALLLNVAGAAVAVPCWGALCLMLFE